MSFAKASTRIIEYLFYSLFLLVPLVFTGNTSELFEFNKMWVTFGIATAIGFFWFSKIIITKKFIFRRTILDIPILIFLISQIISTLISMDIHISLWGYYSRWNGGLFSIITYIFLYYAFVSNFFNNSEQDNNKKGFFERVITGKTIVMRSLLVSVISGFIVVLWSLPSHFGYDPTCLVFRHTFDVSCWTNDFQPKVRIFGPLGQPDWLAGYLGVLLPIAGAFIIQTLRQTKKLLDPRLLFYALSFVLFYLSLLYTGSRSGIASGILSIALFLIIYFLRNIKNLDFIKNKFLLTVFGIILLVSFFAGVRLPIVERFSFSELQKTLTKPDPLSPRAQTQAPEQSPATSGTPFGGSNSYEIRKIVWRGAIDAWKANLVFGTGVETFAFAYYKYRPVEHNRVSEWNFLYNKAHNEYLNYLTTTGAVGLISYLFLIGAIILIPMVNVFSVKVRALKFARSPESYDPRDPVVLSLVFSFLSILMINFFGFSVVILNVYLFVIPAFILILLGLVKEPKENSSKYDAVSYGQWSGIAVLGIVVFIIYYVLITYWIADTKYALGDNFNRAGAYDSAYPLLHEAVKTRSESVYLDSMAINDVQIAINLAAQGSTESAALVQTLIKEALDTSEKQALEHPHNIVTLKNRVRILYALGRLDPAFYPMALEVIKNAAELAPTDATVLYNLGLLHGQSGDSKTAVEVLEKTVSYKPDYTDAHFALGLFYHDLGANDKGQITNASYYDKAINEMKYILEKIDPKNKQAKDSLDLWEKEK